jgi:hypothetical protein
MVCVSARKEGADGKEEEVRGFGGIGECPSTTLTGLIY